MSIASSAGAILVFSQGNTEEERTRVQNPHQVVATQKCRRRKEQIRDSLPLPTLPGGRGRYPTACWAVTMDYHVVAREYRPVRLLTSVRREGYVETWVSHHYRAGPYVTGPRSIRGQESQQ